MEADLSLAKALFSPDAVALTASLDSVREKAAGELERWGERAVPALRRALVGGPSPEARRQIERLLGRLDGPVTAPEALRAVRAVEVLEQAGTPEARRVLEALAGGAPEARLTREAKASLGRLLAR